MRVKGPGIRDVTERGKAFIQCSLQSFHRRYVATQSRPNDARPGWTRKTPKPARPQNERPARPASRLHRPLELFHFAALNVAQEIQCQVNMLRPRPRHRPWRKTARQCARRLSQSLRDLRRRKDRDEQTDRWLPHVGWSRGTLALGTL